MLCSRQTIWILVKSIKNDLIHLSSIKMAGLSSIKMAGLSSIQMAFEYCTIRQTTFEHSHFWDPHCSVQNGIHSLDHAFKCLLCSLGAMVLQTGSVLPTEPITIPNLQLKGSSMPLGHLVSFEFTDSVPYFDRLGITGCIWITGIWITDSCQYRTWRFSLCVMFK